MDRQGKHVALALALDGELPSQLALVLEPVVDLELVLLLHEAADDARLPEVFSTVQLNVHQIAMPWQYVACVAVLEKVDARDVVLLEEDELVFVFHQGFEEGADPCDEGGRSLFEELELVEHLFEDEVGHVHAQVLGQVSRELYQVLDVVFELLVEGLFHVLVQLQR